MADVNLSPSLFIANCTEASVAIIFVALRLYTKARIVRKIDIEEYLVVAALLLMLVNTSIMNVAIHWGIGRHMADLSPEQRLNAMKYLFISVPFGFAGTTVARISFATFLLKFCIASRPWRWTIWSIICIQIVSNSALLLVILFQCWPVTRSWDVNVRGTCLSIDARVISNCTVGAINSLHDLLLLFLPINIIRSLTLRLRVKIMLGLVMCTSALGFIASVVKTIESRVLVDQDFTYKMTWLVIWITVEGCVLICTTSAPSLRPLLLSFIRRSDSKPRFPYGLRWSPTRSRTRWPSAYFRQDSVMGHDPRTFITVAQAVEVPKDWDVEKTGHVETKDATRQISHESLKS